MSIEFIVIGYTSFKSNKLLAYKVGKSVELSDNMGTLLWHIDISVVIVHNKTNVERVVVKAKNFGF